MWAVVCDLSVGLGFDCPEVSNVVDHISGLSLGLCYGMIGSFMLHHKSGFYHAELFT